MGLIVTTGLIAYLGSFSGAFLLDDYRHIVENPRIHQFWPPAAALSGTARPVLMYSLAIDHALGGRDAWIYHATNLGVHLLTALLLFAILKRTFEGPGLRGRFGGAADGLALAIAAVWVVHPLNTQAVTYVIQRGESMAGMFYLATLYATIRGAASHTRARAWYGAAVLVCALGMATKPVMVSAPLVLVLYDRFFLAPSWRELRRRRGWLYAGLAATWGILIGLARVAPDLNVGAGPRTMEPLAYAATQPGVILHYLRLALWPNPLVFDYGWPPASGPSQVLLPGLAVVAILAGMVLAASRLKPVGFLGLWFVCILGPSSSIVPIQDIAVEHRMYLPLVACVALAVTFAYDILVKRAAGPNVRRGATLFAAIVVVVLCGLTMRRNADYADEVTMWADVTAKRPLNPRGHNNLGLALSKKGDLEAATREFRESLRLNPDVPFVHNNLAVALGRQGRTDEEIEHYRSALSLAPDFDEARYNLGLALAGQERYGEAIACFEEGVRRQPAFADARYALGIALARVGRHEEAITHFREVLRFNPDRADVHNALGLSLLQVDRVDEAVAAFRSATRLAPNLAAPHEGLGLALERLGRPDDAIEEYRTATRLAPGVPRLYHRLGNALAGQGRIEEAKASLREASRLDPNSASAHRNLESAAGVPE